MMNFEDLFLDLVVELVQKEHVYREDDGHFVRVRVRVLRLVCDHEYRLEVSYFIEVDHVSSFWIAVTLDDRVRWFVLPAEVAAHAVPALLLKLVL